MLKIALIEEDETDDAIEVAPESSTGANRENRVGQVLNPCVLRFLLLVFSVNLLHNSVANLDNYSSYAATLGRAGNLLVWFQSGCQAAGESFVTLMLTKAGIAIEKPGASTCPSRYEFTAMKHKLFAFLLLALTAVLLSGCATSADTTTTTTTTERTKSSMYVR